MKVASDVGKEQQVRIRPDVLVHTHDGGVIFTSTFERWVKEFDVEPWTLDLLRLLFEGGAPAELRGILKEVDDESFSAVIDVLAEEGITTSLPRPTTTTGRYARQIQFLDVLACCSDVGLAADEIQERVRNARVLVVGAGGAGTHVLQALAQVGVGGIGIVDPDVIEIENLNRQVLYDESHVGLPKVEACKRVLQRMNPDVDVICHQRFIAGPGDLAGIVAGNDVVVSCADHPSVAEVADWVSQACLPLGIPHVVGGSYGANFGVPGYSVLPGKTPCWGCATAFARGRIHSMNDPLVPRQNAGSFAPIVSLVASLVAWDVIRMITGCRPLLAGVLRELDVMTLHWHESTVKVSGECVACEGVPHEK